MEYAKFECQILFDIILKRIILSERNFIIYKYATIQI